MVVKLIHRLHTHIEMEKNVIHFIKHAKAGKSFTKRGENVIHFIKHEKVSQNYHATQNLSARSRNNLNKISQKCNAYYCMSLIFPQRINIILTFYEEQSHNQILSTFSSYTFHTYIFLFRHFMR